MIPIIIHTEYPFAKGNLTSDGIQWSAEVDTATAGITYKWQARNKGGNWIDLHTSVIKENIGTSFIEESCSGRVEIREGLDSLPFDVRLVIKCSESGEGRSRIKNSSCVRVKYTAS